MRHDRTPYTRRDAQDSEAVYASLGLSLEELHATSKDGNRGDYGVRELREGSGARKRRPRAYLGVLHGKLPKKGVNDLTGIALRL